MQYNGRKGEHLVDTLVISRGNLNNTQIAAEISQCNYNVRQFKKTHHNKHLKAKNPHQTISRLNTEPNQISNPNADASFSSLRPKTQADGLNKTLRFNSTFIPPQNSKNKKAFFSKCKNLLTKLCQEAKGLAGIVRNKKV